MHETGVSNATWPGSAEKSPSPETSQLLLIRGVSIPPLVPWRDWKACYELTMGRMVKENSTQTISFFMCPVASPTHTHVHLKNRGERRKEMFYIV